MSKILYFFCLTIPLFSCSGREGDFVKKERIIGRYVFLANKQDTLDVNSNGTFIHYDADDKTLSGTWAYNSDEGFIILNDFWHSGGPWSPKVRAINEEIRFIYATDISDGYYVKIDSIDRKLRTK